MWNLIILDALSSAEGGGGPECERERGREGGWERRREVGWRRDAEGRRG